MALAVTAFDLWRCWALNSTAANWARLGAAANSIAPLSMSGATTVAPSRCARSIIKASLHIKDNLTVTLLTGAPYAIGAIAMVVWGRICDRAGRGIGYTVAPLIVGGVALAVSAFLTTAPWLGYAGLSVCAICIMAAFPCFWTVLPKFLAGVAIAGAIGIVNSIGNLAGFVGPYWMGWITSLSGSSKWGLVTIGLVMVAGAILAQAVGSQRNTPQPVVLDSADSQAVSGS